MTHQVQDPRSTAPGWDKWHDWNARHMAPLTIRTCEAIAAAPGMRALDLACGTGLPALDVARRLQPGGTVLATDVAPDMVAACARRAAVAGLDNLEARVMDMHAPDLAEASFDAVTISFSLMFSPDPIKVMTGVRRLLRPGGRFAAAVWAPREDNTFFATVFGAVGRVLGGPPPDPMAPGPFRLGASGELERVLVAAELSDVTVESIAVLFDFASFDELWECVGDMVPPVRNSILTGSATEVERLREAVTEGAAAYAEPGGRVRFPQVALLATGRRA